MKIDVEERNGRIIVRCEGRLDASTSVQLENQLNSVIEKDTNKLYLDFNKIEYLSSAGMRLLLSCSKKLKDKGGKLTIFALHEDVMEIIRMAGFEQILEICPDESTALGK